MRLLLKASAAFAVAAFLMGTGPFAGPPNPRWGQVAAELAAIQPQARLKAQVAALLFRSGTPQPVAR